MNASSEFDEKEFWLELFSIVARRETTRENEQPVQSIGPEGAIEPEERSESKELYATATFGDLAAERSRFAHLLRSGDC